jgi:hypothetical protein
LLGFSVPKPVGRGLGLGNEIIPWGKAYIGAREFGLRCLHPAWGANPRGYRKEFGTGRLDWANYRLLGLLPTVDVTDEMVEVTGARFDYAAAMHALAAHLVRRKAMILRHESMSGGYLGIRTARRYLQSQTVFHPRVLTSAREHMRLPGELRVVMHVRLDDFSESKEGPTPGIFNVAVPGAWFEEIGELLRHTLGEPIEIVVLSDSESSRVVKLRQSLGAKGREPPRSMLNDLELMTTADLLICSISSFSMLAAFLSDSPYVWFAPHLGDDAGWLSIWGHEPLQRLGPTQRNAATAVEPWGRGFAMGLSESELPTELCSALEMRRRLRDERNDLIYYGVIKQ